MTAVLAGPETFVTLAIWVLYGMQSIHDVDPLASTLIAFSALEAAGGTSVRYGKSTSCTAPC
jgi:hypothetical protein